MNSRSKGPRTTTSGHNPDDRPELVDHDFTATAPSELRGQGHHLLPHLRRMDAWRPSSLMCSLARWPAGNYLVTSRTDLALKVGIWTCQRQRQDLADLTHRSDKGSQRLSARYIQRRTEAGVVASVGSTGESFDSALAEAFNSLFKAELAGNRSPWKGIDDLGFATAEYIDWFNHRCLHGGIGTILHRARGYLPSQSDRSGNRRGGTYVSLTNPGRFSLAREQFEN